MEVPLLQASVLLKSCVVSGAPGVEIQAVAGSLGPPGGAGVHSILWAIGELPHQLPV